MNHDILKLKQALQTASPDQIKVSSFLFRLAGGGVGVAIRINTGSEMIETGTMFPDHDYPEAPKELGEIPNALSEHGYTLVSSRTSPGGGIRWYTFSKK